MTEPIQGKSSWKAAMWESGAVGWAALGALIVLIVVGAFIFGRGPEKGAQEAARAPVQTTQ